MVLPVGYPLIRGWAIVLIVQVNILHVSGLEPDEGFLALLCGLAQVYKFGVSHICIVALLAVGLDQQVIDVGFLPGVHLV